MQEQQNLNMADSATTPVASEVSSDTATLSGTQQTPARPERTYTREQVINMMMKRVERSHNAFFNRYGVKDLDELDNLFDEGKSIKDEYAKLQLANSDLTRTNAFLKNNIIPEKYDDVKAYFKGTDTEFSEDALLQAISTHPEWLKPSNVPAQTTIKTLGSEAHINPSVDESAMAGKLLGVNF